MSADLIAFPNSHAPTVPAPGARLAVLAVLAALALRRFAFLGSYGAGA
jgi:hypothetical protein